MVDTVSSFAGLNSSGQSGRTARTSLGDNFDTFLTLLTAQLQNQDPLSPVDSTEFTSQLVQFSGVEQQIRMNDQLEAMIGLQQSSFAASLSGYLGQDVLLDTSAVQFDGETPIELRYRVDSSATAATVTIRDAQNRVVFEGPVPTGGGELSFSWDGDRSGATTPAGAGTYSISVTASNATGAAVGAGGAILARVSGLDLSSGTPSVVTSAGNFPVGLIMRVARPVAA
jgi:flagellar basal-body rod modification protein FlgD